MAVDLRGLLILWQTRHQLSSCSRSSVPELHAASDDLGWQISAFPPQIPLHISLSPASPTGQAWAR